MLGPLGHIGAWFAYQARRGARRHADQTTASQLLTAPSLPAGLSLTWVGTAGFRFDYQGQTLWIDPYLTRFSLGKMLRHAVTAPDKTVLNKIVDRADVVLIGHTHFDHALDAPAIAAQFNCPVYGSASMTHLMKLHGRPELGITVEPYRIYEHGPFRFSFVPSVHSKLALGLATPHNGELTCDHLDHLTPQRYRCGQVWGIHLEVAGVTFYHQGSADLIDDAITHRHVDYFLCGIAGRRFTRDYASRILRKLEPRAIIPTHYDDFFRPLSAPLGFSMNVNLTAFAEEVRRVSADFNVQVVERYDPGA